MSQTATPPPAAPPPVPVPAGHGAPAPKLTRRRRRVRAAGSIDRGTFVKFVAASIIIMVALMAFPLVNAVWLSFHKVLLRSLDTSEWVGLGNYTEVLTDSDFWAAVRFTLVFVAITVPVQMGLGLGIALLLDRVGRGRAIYIAALLLPFVVTPVVGTIIYKDLFERGGVIAWLLETITNQPFLITDSNVTWLIITQAIWHVTPFAMITMFAGLQTLPESRMEAASIDGAGFWNRVWHIIIPHLRTILLFIALISIMDAYRVFDSVFVFSGNRFESAQTLMVYNFNVALDANIGRVGKGNAIAILTVIGIFVVLVPFLRMSYRDQIAERR